MDLIDSLAHLDDPRVSDVPSLLARAARAGVRTVIHGGFDPLRRRAETTEVEPRTEENGSQSPSKPDRAPPSPEHSINVWRGFGLHPSAIDPPRVTEQLDALVALLDRDDAVAVGEIGLDARDTMPPWGLQEHVFSVQLRMALHLGKPVIIHCVRCPGRVLAALKEVGPLPAGGLMHAFAGPEEMIPDFLKQNMYFSFGGEVTRDRAKRSRAAVPAVPKDRLLVESDTPDHPPVGWEGALSEPAALNYTVCALAHLRGESPAEVAAQTAANARQLYGLRQ